MRVLVETKGMDKDEWLLHRKNGIGGSDASAIAGVNKYKSKLVLYMEKVGIFEQVVDSESAYWGNQLEDIVAQEFIKRYNAELSESPELSEHFDPKPTARIQRRNAILMHDEHDFMLASVDRLLMCPVKGRGILEVKTASLRVADDWKGEDIPEMYFIQVQHYLAITGLNYAYVAVLIGGQEFRMYYIARDQEFINDLITLEKQFWYDHVLAEVAPSIDGSDSTSEMYKLLYPQSYEGRPVLELTSEAIEWVENVQNAKAQVDAWKETKQEFENKLKDQMQEAEKANAGPHQITWKTDKRGVRAMKIKLGK